MLLTSNTAKSYPFEAIGVPNYLPDLVAINKEFRNEPNVKYPTYIQIYEFVTRKLNITTGL